MRCARSPCTQRARKPKPTVRAHRLHATPGLALIARLLSSTNSGGHLPRGKDGPRLSARLDGSGRSLPRTAGSPRVRLLDNPRYTAQVAQSLSARENRLRNGSRAWCNPASTLSIRFDGTYLAYLNAALNSHQNYKFRSQCRPPLLAPALKTPPALLPCLAHRRVWP